MQLKEVKDIVKASDLKIKAQELMIKLKNKLIK